MSTINNNPTPASIKAQEGLKQMPRNAGMAQQAKAGDTFVTSIREEAGDVKERELCRVAQETAAKVNSDATKAALHRGTLNAVAAGLAGSMGGVLAGLGLEVMKKESASPQPDQVQVGKRLLAEISAQPEASVSEKTLSEMAGTTLSRLDTNTSKVAVAQAMLQAINTGLAANLGGMLAGVGVQAVHGVGQEQPKNQAVAGSQFLQNIAAKGSPEEQLLSGIALNAFTSADSHAARSAVADAALSVLASGGQEVPGLKLAQMGSQAVAATSPEEVKNRSNVGTRFLEGILENSPSDSPQGQLARVASAVCDGLDEYSARAAVAQAALDSIKTAGEELDLRMARVGATALTGFTGQVANRAAIAGAFTQAVSEQTKDDSRRQAAQDALQKAHETSSYETKAEVLAEFLKACAPNVTPLEMKASENPKAGPKAEEVKAAEAKPAEVVKPKLDDATAAEVKKVKDAVTEQVAPDWGTRLDEEISKGLAEGKLPDPKDLSDSLFPTQ
ncbi:hypothetical protein JST97_26695, partial [bacterium]|nr:hypothetical protein [bacterium]